MEVKISPTIFAPLFSLRRFRSAIIAPKLSHFLSAVFAPPFSLRPNAKEVIYFQGEQKKKHFSHNACSIDNAYIENKPEMNFRANVRHKFEIWKTSGKMQ